MPVRPSVPFLWKRFLVCVLKDEILGYSCERSPLFTCLTFGINMDVNAWAKGPAARCQLQSFFFLKFMSCEKVLGPVPSCYFVTNPLNRNITIKLINKPRCPLSGGYPVQGCICLLNFSLISLSTFLFFFFSSWMCLIHLKTQLCDTRPLQQKSSSAYLPCWWQ